ncbi:carbohydrate-binding module family 48 protein [Cylindrobasidium torrendii FP15055 ss-10]|uniref:Carbohydrate-binding module family 48 protein n=1 Tax=Cylindrobasidium torrendii FP15055 ss-10 TaxID=1314674 RepID=A0A0D7AYX2_9AGAR|nr:carbohydrate-binding module family 48 protein [Cylindrobasidium torrendii FP15055 ss-10]
MGNAPSNQQEIDSPRSRSPPARRLASRAESPRADSPQPGPGRPHQSLRYKRRSLDLPDINLITAPLPIPTRAERPKGRRQTSGDGLGSFSSQSYGQLPAPPPSVENYPSFADVGGADGRESPQYDRPVVRSTLPMPLNAVDATETPDPSNDAIETPIVWTGEGDSVFVSHMVDDVEVRVPMHREGRRFIANLKLPRGTHHLLFVVDSAFRVAADMPKTVNSQGTLTNYVSVGLSSPPELNNTPVPRRSHSFWSSSSAGGAAPGLEWNQRPRESGTPEWTNVIPPELQEAVADEEAAMQASASAKSSANGHRHVVNGFQPLPLQREIPTAPPLPRHLEKQILNETRPVSSPSSNRDKRRNRHGHWHDSHGHGHSHGHHSRHMPGLSTPQDQLTPRVLPVTTASGTDIAAFSGGSTPSSPTPLPTPTAGPVVENEDAIADDNSVLPVPSHVILNHLSTSTVRDNVLAVAVTVRYKAKFLTTIYYKPT